MPGLSNVERAGCAKILALMPKGDVLSLCDTVTNKMIVVENLTEAMETILSFTKDAEEFLKRKKVQRDLIFKYLAKEGVIIPPNSEKHQLAKRALELWSSGKAVVDQSLPRQTDETRQRPTSTHVNVEVGFDPLALGHQFCQWFFQLLNSHNPSLGQPPQDWGPQHFWPDAKLCLLARAGSVQMEDFHGADLVSRRLQALTKQEHLLLSPNLEPLGLRTLASPHGLVLVAVAGTIHRNGVCLGIFEKIFGLIRSPLENNSWKIKSVHLKIKGQDALGGKEIVAPALSYSSTTEMQLLCRS
ncbi:uncharacterized protein C3orf38 homolog isoform X1 [Sebastes umbrosus]|uniref:uncharacterized protein C3orf38 homolog isoform X1 n=1 Tax=Sebastes umbrosus TaxID=72105 RepID=UPI00189D370A|nr:uncharacterized protein C3orf38 homolog isoform X1 [Sebastes umbrosus]